MSKFLIEVEHDGTAAACARAVEVFLRTGSHFVTHADWGCKDGEHKAWIVVEADNKEEARGIVPSVFRAKAKIVQLNTFTLQDVEGVLRDHKV